VAQILAATGGELVRGPIHGDWTLCTDSRLMEDGTIFLALRGEIHDGHAWVTRAVQGRRAGALVEEVPADLPDEVGGPIIRVPDTLPRRRSPARWARPPRARCSPRSWSSSAPACRQRATSTTGSGCP
jgi:UDP-N-acetylmuramoyl-tripeptide--D-alanyl-D-alanine ligase